MQCHRLQLGASRLEKLTPAALSVFLNESWVHLGNPPEHFLKRLPMVLLGRYPSFKKMRAMYRATEFREFWFQPGDRLPFEDGSFTFIFSEHFFEHLPLALAIELFRECHRVLRIGGIIRTVVPDAVWRTYEPPEPAFDHPTHPEGPPTVHKIRWTNPLLSKSLMDCGLRPIPLNYCTEDRRHIVRNPQEIRAEYEQGVSCLEWPLITDMSYIRFKQSLFVDAIRDR